MAPAKRTALQHMATEILTAIRAEKKRRRTAESASETKRPGRECNPAEPWSSAIPPKEKPMNKAKPTIDVPNSATDDEVVRLGIRWNAAHSRIEVLSGKAFDAKQANQISACIYNDSAAENAEDEVDAVRTMLRSTKATSLAGAALQIMEALNLVDAIEDFVRDDERTFMFKRCVREVDRLLFSAMDLVDSLSDQKLADIAPAVYQPNLNPWTPVEDVLASIHGSAAR